MSDELTTDETAMLSDLTAVLTAQMTPTFSCFVVILITFLDDPQTADSRVALTQS